MYSFGAMNAAGHRREMAQGTKKGKKIQGRLDRHKQFKRGERNRASTNIPRQHEYRGPLSPSLQADVTKHPLPHRCQAPAPPACFQPPALPDPKGWPRRFRRVRAASDAWGGGGRLRPFAIVALGGHAHEPARQRRLCLHREQRNSRLVVAPLT
jgi:hypothetical protein